MPKTGWARLYAACGYSWSGLCQAWQKEAAFRQELCLFAALTVLLFFLPFDLLWKALLLFAMGLVLMVELLNSALEAVVDLAAPDYHILAKRSKDMASAAVWLGLVLTALLWLLALMDYLV